MYTFLDFTSKIAGGGGLIHQFGIWLGHDLKNRLLLLLLTVTAIYYPCISCQHKYLVLYLENKNTVALLVILDQL
jgi:hypothetical protein